MIAKVRRSVLLLAVSTALFVISAVFTTPKNAFWMDWVRGASAGIALAATIGIILIITENLKGKK